MNATFAFMIGLVFTLWPGRPDQSSLLELTFSISKKDQILGTYFRSQTCEKTSNSWTGTDNRPNLNPVLTSGSKSHIQITWWPYHITMTMWLHTRGRHRWELLGWLTLANSAHCNEMQSTFTGVQIWFWSLGFWVFSVGFRV